MNEFDTIAAISTATGKGAISIVRVSGSNAIQILNKIFKGKDLTKVKTHTIHYGYIVDQKEEIDEVLVMVMKSPKTYTMEDIVEINCHGSIYVANRVLELLLQKGARIAEPGEFTKRAFLNGRINLLEAEAVGDLIQSKSEKQRAVAMNGLNGRLTNLIKKEREILLELLANIAVNIDYPEYEDAIEVTEDFLKNKLINIKSDLELLLQNAKIGQIIKSGINIALVGKPNVGKSSLLNAFLNEDKAIVTDISGTTRDLIEATTILEGIEINLIDTAGIRQTHDVVEQIGVNKSQKIIETSDLVILVLNNNEILSKEDQNLIEKIKKRPHIIFINKNDLPKKINISEDLKVIEGNTKELNGLEALKNEIKTMYQLDKINPNDSTYLSNIRQVNLVQEALEEIQTSLKDLSKKIPIDMLEIHIRSSWEKLGILIGENYEDELIDKLFKNFCLGK